MIEELYVIYRPIGSDDEASTEEEQAEKILFSYPVTQSLRQQLTRITMLEGLIDFTGRFSKQDIDTVVMERQTWSFVQPEAGLWFIACVSSGNSQQTSEESTKVSGSGLVDALGKMYDEFSLFRGNIRNIIDRGITVVEDVQGLRKKGRKIRRRLEQEQLDLDSVRLDTAHIEKDKDVERVGIRAHNSLTLEQLQGAVDVSNTEISMIEEKLVALLGASANPLPGLRRSLGSFCQWYISSGDLSMPNGLHGMRGMHYCTVGHPAFQALTRVRQAVEDISSGLCKKIVIIHDGQVVWSDCDDETTLHLYEFARMQENARHRRMTRQFEKMKKQQASAAALASSRSGGQVSKRQVDSRKQSSAKGDPTSRSGSSPASEVSSLRGEDSRALQASPSQSPEEWLQAQVDQSGFVTCGWGLCDLMEQPISPIDHEGTDEPLPVPAPGLPSSQEIGHNGGGLTPPAPPVDVGDVLQDSDHKYLWTGLDGPQGIFFPPIFTSVSAPEEGGGEEEEEEEEGEEEEEEGEEEEEEEEVGSGSGAGELDEDIEPLRGPLESIGRVLVYRQASFLLAMVVSDQAAPEGRSGRLNDDALEVSNTNAAESRVSITDFNSLLQHEGQARSSISAALYMGSDLSTSVGPGLEDGDRWVAAGLNEPRGVLNLCSMLQYGICGVMDNLLVLLVNKNRHLSVYGLQWRWKAALHDHRDANFSRDRSESTVAPEAGGYGEVNGISDEATSDTSSGSRKRSSKRGKLPFMDSSLVVPIPARAVNVPGGLPRGVHAYYFNASNRAVKAPDFYLRNVDPLLYWPSPVLSRASYGSSSNSADSVSVGWTDSMSEVLSDEYLSDLLSLYRHRFPLPPSFLATTLPPKTLAALTELREALTVRFNRSITPCTEVCLRLTSPQRGGDWVVGRRSGGRFLFVLIEGCPAIGDMHSRLMRTVDGVFGRVIV